MATFRGTFDYTLDAKNRLAPLEIIAEEPAIGAFLLVRGALQRPTGDVELRLQIEIVQEPGEQILSGIGEVHIRRAVRNVATDIDTRPHLQQPYSQTAAQARRHVLGDDDEQRHY